MTLASVQYLTKQIFRLTFQLSKRSGIRYPGYKTMKTEIGIVLRSLLDGELAMASPEILTNYNIRNELIDKLEARLSEIDWVSLSDGTTFAKSFVPKGRD